MKSLLLASTILTLAAALPHAYAQSACTLGSPGAVNSNPNAVATGNFSVSDGQIIGPNGQVFIAKGINIGPSQMGGANQILADFPGINFIRLATGSYDDPSVYAAFIQTMSTHGVVVEIEDHTIWAGSQAPYTGSQLAPETAWYASLASAYANNPDVWFGTENEPGLQNGVAAVSDQHVAIYNAIRATGNTNMVMLELPGGGEPNTIGAAGGMVTSDYSGMTNVAFDLHYYGWISGQSQNQATVNAGLMGSANSGSGIAAAQSMSSAQGTIPVIIGEYGPSTDGMSDDADGSQVLTAVQQSGYGSVAWAYDPGQADVLVNSDGSLTSFGQEVAQWIATSCPVVAPIVTAASAPSSAPVVSTAPVPTPDANTLSIADVAQLAATGAAPGSVLPASGASIPTLPDSTDLVGPVPTQPPLAVPSPTGTMPTPAPVTGSVSDDASGDYQTITPGAGNGTGTVSGTGNVIAATGGIQTITVTGPGNQLQLGPYNDTVTLSSAGNTVNDGGGNDTVILAYNGQAPSSVINADADAAAVSPLATVGNTLMAPAPGTGTLTIQGVLAQNDRIDLTQALAGTTWDGSMSTIWQYVDAAATSGGCTISIGGQVVVRLPNGSPNGNIGSFITAGAGT